MEVCALMREGRGGFLEVCALMREAKVRKEVCALLREDKRGSDAQTQENKQKFLIFLVRSSKQR